MHTEAQPQDVKNNYFYINVAVQMKSKPSLILKV